MMRILILPTLAAAIGDSHIREELASFAESLLGSRESDLHIPGGGSLESGHVHDDVEESLEVLSGYEGVVNHAERAGSQLYLSSLNSAALCQGFMFEYDGAFGCKLSLTFVIMITLLPTLIEIAVWWLCCRYKGRATRTVEDSALNEVPFEPVGICTCWSFKGKAICETCFCWHFMWAETAFRSGILPLPAVFFILLCSYILGVFVGSVAIVFFVGRVLARFMLRQKLHPGAPSDCKSWFFDACCVFWCPCCTIAQETEYLELKANGGKPAEDGMDYGFSHQPKAV